MGLLQDPADDRNTRAAKAKQIQRKWRNPCEGSQENSKRETQNLRRDFAGRIQYKIKGCFISRVPKKWGK